MNVDINYILDLTEELLSIPSPVGYTHLGIARIAEELDKFGIRYEYTKKGAILAFVEGENREYRKMISAHIDTLGAVVRNVKANGRLELTNTGGYAWGSVEGENVLVHTLSGKVYEGTLLPVKPSVSSLYFREFVIFYFFINFNRFKKATARFYIRIYYIL